jgi:hypothetical protein
MILLLSYLPRRWLQFALETQWERALPQGERVRYRYWGATGNPAHHEFAWADSLAGGTTHNPEQFLTERNEILRARVAKLEKALEDHKAVHQKWAIALVAAWLREQDKHGEWQEAADAIDKEFLEWSLDD